MIESIDNFDVRSGLKHYIEQQHGDGLYLVVHPKNTEDLYNRVTVICRVDEEELPDLIERAHPGFRATLEFDEAIGETIIGRQVDVFEDGSFLSVDEVKQRFLQPARRVRGSIFSLNRLTIGIATAVGVGAAIVYFR